MGGMSALIAKVGVLCCAAFQLSPTFSAFVLCSLMLAPFASLSGQGFLTRAELLETVSQNENKITQRPEPVSRMTLPLTESKPVSSSESNFAAIPGSAVTFENSPNKLLSSSSTVLPTLVPRDVSSPSDSHSGSTALEVVQDSPFRTQIPLQPSDNPVGRLSSMTPGFTVIGTISSLADERIINSNLVRPSTRFVPFIKPSPKPKITDLAFSQDLNYQSDSVYYDDGSGEYSETVTFEGPDMEDVSSVTNVPPNMDDVEDLNYESYDTSFPSRPMLPLSSVYIPHSAATQAFQTFKDSQSQDSLDSTVSSYSSVENNSQIDYAEPFTIEPTELLLPDMNSLEYYSTLLAMENASLPEQAGQTENHTSTAYTSNGTAEPDQMHSVISASMLMENLSQVNISVGTKVSDLLSPSFDSGAPSTSSSFDEFTLKPSSSIAFSNTLSFDTGTLPMSLEPSPNLSQFSFTEMSSFSTSLSSAEKGIVSETSNIYSFSSEQSTVEPTMAMKASTISSLSYWEGWFTSIAGTDPLKAFTKTSVPFPQLTTSETEATRIFSSTLADFPYFSLSVQPTRMLPDVDSTASLVVTSSHHKTVMLWFGSSSATTDIKSSTTGIPGVSLTESLVVSSSSSSEAVPLSTIISVPPNPGTAAPQINTATDEIHTGFSVTLVSNKITTTGNTPSTPTASTSTSTSGTNIPSTSAVFTSSEPNIATSSSLTTSATLSPGSTNLATTSTTTVTTTTTTQPFLCDVTISDTYLVRAELPKDGEEKRAITFIKEVLSHQFNRSVELQVLNSSADILFLVTSGPVIYTAIAVINAMQLSKQDPSIITSVRPSVTVPDYHFQVHTVLQFVPTYVDVRFCNFSQRIEKGLTMAFSEVRRRVQDTDEFTVQVLNITMNASYLEKLQRHPVDIAFAIRDTFGFLNGSRVSNLLRNLSMVEFSFYLGYPVLQIAEPFHYPELNTTHLLRFSWIRTVLLGVLEHRLLEKTFQAEMERKLALLLEEVLLPVGRWKRATSVGNNSVQIVKTSRIEGADNPLEMIYFVEGQNGQRLRATTASSLINRIDLQKAAIVLGYRVQEKLAQPVEKTEEPSTETQNNNLWIIVGVVVPVIVVVIIIIILYWKLCRTDKLEFQPDTMSNVQQRQKLQAPSVKGFDFAKLHLGQHNKDDILVIQEPTPLPLPVKEMTPSENGDAPTPKSKTSSKPSRGGRRRGRISPSDAESTVSEPSSGKESAEETMKPTATLCEDKEHRKVAKNEPPQNSGTEEQLSSASIFEHVDRISRSSEASRRIPNKIQLIAMQPMPAPPLHNPVVTERVVETMKINKEIQTALRHKSEIEHHRNKIRLRAKRKGHYEFPIMDDIGVTDSKERKRIYQKAQMQIDRILDPELNASPMLMESRKSSRGKRSPKQKKKHQPNGSVTDADKDRLITTDSDGTYKKPPGVNNVAYVSDPDQPVEPRSPSPQENEVFSGSPPHTHSLPPPAYLPPQPSIEEARQQMHSLLDDAFALVAPSTQGGNVGITIPGITSGQPGTSPPTRGSRGAGTGQWGPPHVPALLSNRYADLGVSPTPAPALIQRQVHGQGFSQSGESGRQQDQQEEVYATRGVYGEEMPSSARPRPVGGSTGAQLHHLAQVGLSSRINSHQGQPGRTGQSQSGGSGWTSYRPEEEYTRSNHHRDPAQIVGFPEYSSSVFQMPKTSLREPSAPVGLILEPAGPGFPSVTADESNTGHSSASLIKAIREELLRLSQKQSAVQSFHS
ncbi:UPF0606 protein KIAA1549-like isoform X2 [Polypterus senegalus]|uniref:UPF0606 protein KIAA1549-like isoform X2 n=1 Tax=Polypterus senegalus TaxID=55291 RepID=UPI0019655350|nr:UPF0606 protein KIAA1549-like isoform X2 [Polypterus senegalus]